MKDSKIVIGFLILAGLVGLYVGGGLLFFPAGMQAPNGIVIGDNASLFSETRAPGAAIFGASLLMILPVFRSEWRRMGLVIASLFFLSYGLGRLLSLVMDGQPADALYFAMFGELALGGIALILFFRPSKTTT